MSTYTDRIIDYGHKFGNFLVAMFDKMNDSTSSENPVTLEEVLKNDKSHRMSLDEPEESLYDFYASENNFSNKNPAFDDEVVITFFGNPIKKEMNFHKIDYTDLDFSLKNQLFLTYSQVVEELTFPMLELPHVVSNHHDKDTKTNTLSDEITDFSDSEKVIEQPKNVLLTDYQEFNVLYIGFCSWMKLYSILFHSQKCELFWAAREILSQELLSGQLTGFYQSLRGLFKQILSLDLLSGQLCCFKKVRGLFHQILSSDLLSGQLC
jgi:hypothetical protein